MAITQPPCTSSSKPSLYFPAIDGLRLFAAVNVVLYHFEQSGGFSNLNGHPAWFFIIVKGPMFHASLFFILGGFIFTVKFAGVVDRFNARAFLISRFRDLYPLHVITTLLMVPLVLQWSGGRIVENVQSLLMHLGLVWSFYPVGTASLNTPSWALSAFFLCYLLFRPTLKMVTRISRRRDVLACMLLAMVPVLLWASLYVLIGAPWRWYRLFHMFAPIRFFEFVTGMLMARFFMLSSRGKQAARHKALLNDSIILGCIGLLFVNLISRYWFGNGYRFFSYHVFVLPLYMLLLYAFAEGSGVCARCTSRMPVRRLGQSSFYPYLLHIPLMSWFTHFLSTQFGFRSFLHHPWNVFIFVIVLYFGSAMYVTFFRCKKSRLSLQHAGESKLR